jgi:hypothetical protein
MKCTTISLLLAGCFIALSTMEASAVVCARGVYRAGCVGAGGGVVARRPVVRPVARAVVVAPGCTNNPSTHQLKTCRADNAQHSICGRTVAGDFRCSRSSAEGHQSRAWLS